MPTSLVLGCCLHSFRTNQLTKKAGCIGISLNRTYYTSKAIHLKPPCATSESFIPVQQTRTLPLQLGDICRQKSSRGGLIATTEDRHLDACSCSDCCLDKSRVAAVRLGFNSTMGLISFHFSASLGSIRGSLRSTSRQLNTRNLYRYEMVMKLHRSPEMRSRNREPGALLITPSSLRTRIRHLTPDR